MATTLKFNKEGDAYVAKFTSEGACVIQLEREKPSLVAVSANLDGMNPVPVASFQNPYTANAIFNVNLPEGVEVTIKSVSEVKNAKRT